MFYSSFGSVLLLLGCGWAAGWNGRGAKVQKPPLDLEALGKRNPPSISSNSITFCGCHFISQLVVALHGDQLDPAFGTW